MPEIKQRIPTLATRAAVQPASFSRNDRTVELTWTTGAQVRRFDWFEGPYIEELSMDPKHIRMSRMGAGAPVLKDHNSASIDNVIGVVEKAWLDNGQGRAVVRFADDPAVEPILAKIESGILRNISVGYQVHEYEVDKTEKGEMPTYRAIDWEPVEVSIVAVPADPSAQIRSQDNLHSVAITTRSDDMSDPIENPIPADEAQTPEAPVIPDAAEIAQRAIAMERTRIAGIRETVRMAKMNDKVADDLITAGTPLDQARNEVLRMWSEKTDATATVSGGTEIVRDERDTRVERATAALMARAGLLQGREADEASQGNPYRYHKLYDLAKECAERAGMNTFGMDPKNVVRGAITQGTSDFPVILENTMHKSLLGAFQATPDTWSQFCSTDSVSDFRDWKRIDTGTISSLDTVNELGEFTNLAIPDGNAEHIAVTTKGNIVTISRQAIINDDLSYFNRISTMLGRAAARSIERDVYALLAANPTMDDGNALFSANHANYDSGGDAISIASLSAARLAMRSQKDLSGNDYIDNNMPAILLCPIAKGQLARETILSVYDPETSNKLQRRNDVNGIVATIIDTPRLSGNGWYLFANPTQQSVIEVAFLNGVRAPYLETEQGFDVDGVRYKVRFDYGVGAVGYRGAFHNVGS
jgi:hypothetical protein